MPRSASEDDLAHIAAQFGDDPAGVTASSDINGHGTIWLWRAKDASVTAAWHFLSLTGAVSDALRARSVGRKGGFGSIKVEAQIGDTRWMTSVFPERATGGYMLPLKAQVRKRENLSADMTVAVSLRIV